MKDGYVTNGPSGTQISYIYSSNSGAWHHYVLQREGDNIVKFYVDGVLVDNVTTYITNNINASKVVFGGNKNGLYPVAPSMRLDNIRFYNRTLTSAQVRAIYNLEVSNH